MLLPFLPSSNIDPRQTYTRWIIFPRLSKRRKILSIAIIGFWKLAFLQLCVREYYRERRRIFGELALPQFLRHENPRVILAQDNLTSMENGEIRIRETRTTWLILTRIKPLFYGYFYTWVFTSVYGQRDGLTFTENLSKKSLFKILGNKWWQFCVTFYVSTRHANMFLSSKLLVGESFIRIGRFSRKRCLKKKKEKWKRFNAIWIFSSW